MDRTSDRSTSCRAAQYTGRAVTLNSLGQDAQRSRRGVVRSTIDASTVAAA
jgi:hypothetical protein